ncbi:bacterio-opsin activator domain-containing protein [Halomicroarcula sp. GCM10025709]
MAVAQNVTEQRERQWELERSNSLLSTLLDTLPLGILVEDSDREITAVNQQFLDMFELLGTPEGLVGRDCVAQARDVCELFVDGTAFVEGIASVPAQHRARHDQELELHDGRIFERSAVPVSLTDGRGTIWLYRDVTDRVQDERELAETTERLDLALEGAELAVWDWDLETGSVTRNDRWAAMLGYDPDDIADELDEWAQRIHPADRDRAEAELAAHFEGETDYYQCDIRLQTKSGEYRWVRDSGKVFEWDDAGEPIRAVGIHQDITARKEQKRELRRQRDELELLARIHSLIQDVIRALGAAASREEIEEIVCRQLVESSLYQFAWVGEREGGDNRLATRTAAGDDDGYLDIVRERATAADREQGPGTVAVATGEVQVVRDVTEEPTMTDWRDEATERGYRSAAAIPLVHNDVVHGVLVVYATRPDAFSDRAVESFTVLGEMVGFALTAVQNRQLLAHDTALELTYRARDDPLVAAAARADCRIELAGSVAVEDGSLQYLRITDGDPAVVLDAVREEGAAVDGRIVADDGTHGVVELTTPDGFEASLLDVGARLQSVVATPTELVVTTEAPTDADPRTIRDVLARRAPSTELTAKHERTRSPASLTDTVTVTDGLTDRQQEVLRAAYFAGYYAWPRDTTAEQLSERLGIASPTLHQHLRRAQRNLLGALFDD